MNGEPQNNWREDYLLVVLCIGIRNISYSLLGFQAMQLCYDSVLDFGGSQCKVQLGGSVVLVQLC